MNVLAFWRIKIHTINRFIGTNKRRVINVAVDDVRGGRSLLARAGAIAHITTKHHLLSACFFFNDRYQPASEYNADDESGGRLSRTIHRRL